jgi:hydroxypyruvate isomerase
MDIFDEGTKVGESISRRRLLQMSALAPLAFGFNPAPASGGVVGGLPAPQYTLSVNIEMMFSRKIPQGERVELVAALGARAFSFFKVEVGQEAPMLAAQKRAGLACGSIAGALDNRIGLTAGLTKTGNEQAYLDVIARNCEVANKFGCPNLVIFVGEVQQEIPWEKQYRQIVNGLGKAGEIAERHGVYLCLEPLNAVDTPRMSILTTREAFKVIAEVNHPRVRLDYDLYHRQMNDGNLINNLKLGLEKGWIQFVEVGDVPGRKEPGTGEVNYSNIFRALRESNYRGYVGLEHGASSTPEQAFAAVKNLAGVK